MLSLRELQTDFIGGAVRRRAQLRARAGRGEGRRARAPVELYRNNVHANFIDSSSSFPAVWRLVGEDYFAKLRASTNKCTRRGPAICCMPAPPLPGF